MNKEEIQARVNEIKWFHNYELLPGVLTNSYGLVREEERAAYFQIPEDMRGKRVLDIGCADGYFTFLAESRGASVVAIDAWPHQGFALAHEVRGSKAEFHQMDLYELRPDTFGVFDIVFFMGVYYHLKNPILALERIASVTRELAIIESQIMNLSLNEGEGISRFYEHDELAPGDPTNWWVPNVPCLLQTIRAAGFPRTALINTYYNDSRGIVHAYKGPRTAARMLTEDFVCAIHSPAPVAEVSGIVRVSGVAFSKLEPTGGIEQVGVYLDNLDDPTSELGQADLGSWHPEIAARVGEQYGPIGFEFAWNTTDVRPGQHTLYILAEGRRGWHYARQPITVKGSSPGQLFGQIFQKQTKTEIHQKSANHSPSTKVQTQPFQPGSSETSLGDNSPLGREALAAIRSKLPEAELLGGDIGVSLSTQPGWSIGDKVRRAFHQLAIYYVNMLAGKQRVVNQALIALLKQLVVSLEQRESNIEALQEEVTSLRAELQALTAKLKDGHD